MLLVKHILTSLFFLFTTCLFSQTDIECIYQRDYQTKFEQYSIDEGLSSRRILDIHQDKYGYLWVATENGLNRFDGYSFITYFHDDKDSTSISNNHVTSIAEDKYGKLWFGTQNGLNAFDRERESFKVFRYKEFDKNSLSNNYVRTLYADTSGILWIETIDGVLNKFDVEKENYTHYIHEKIKQPYYEYHQIYKDREGDLWIGGRSMGPYRFDIKNEKFTFYRADPNNPEKKRDNDVAAFFEDSRGNFWISGTDGIYTFEKPTGKFSKFFGTSTFGIVEDKNGQLWFATGNGILKFDPETKKLSHFKSDPNNPHSLGEDDVNCLFEDRSGNMWFGTNNGLYKYSRKKYKFPHIYHIPGNEKTIISNRISALMQDEDGNLWIGTDGDGLDKMNLKTNTIRHYQHDPEIKGSLASNTVSDLYQDKNGDIWIGLWRGIGFNKYNKNPDNFTLYSYNPNSLKSDWYNDFLEDSEGNFWAGFWGASGMREFDRKAGQFTDKLFNPLINNPINKKISALEYDGEGFLWIGCSMESSLYKYDFRNDEISKVQFSNDGNNCNNTGTIGFVSLFDGKVVIIRKDALGLFDGHNNYIKCIGLPGKSQHIKSVEKTDNDSVILINTNKGIYKFFTYQRKYQRLQPDSIFRNSRLLTYSKDKLFFVTSNKIYEYTFNTGKAKSLEIDLEYNRITSILYDERSKLWIGTEEGIYRFNVLTKQISIFHKKNKSKTSLSGELVTTLYKDADENIWIGTIHGLNRYNPDDSSITVYRSDETKPGRLIHDHILSIEQDKYGDYWIGTSLGLCKLQRNSGKFISYNKPDKHSLTSRLTTVMYEDSKGDIWVGTSDKGLNRISNDTKLIDHFTHKIYDSTSISDNEVNCIYEDSRGNLWVGTKSGLNKFDPATMSFTRYGRDIIFPDLQIMAILEDDAGNLWISTQNGLVRFDPVKKKTTSFFKLDGLQSNRFSKAHCKLEDGRLAFGGENGINLFDPEALTQNTQVPKMEITAFNKFDKTVQTDFTRKNQIELSYNENFFTIHFSSLDFTAPEKNQYLYKLEGVNDDWVKAGNRNIASYTDISPGEYKFKVKGTNNDGIWSNEAALLKITLKPPFYKTAWFILTISILIIITIAIYLRLRILGLKQAKHNVELEQRLLRSQMNPHFIFNFLTSIQHYVLDKETTKANHYLAKFSKLLRLILDNSRNNYITLDQEVQTIEHYLLLQKIRYGDKFDYYIELDNSIDKQNIIIPPMLTQPFIENSIEHGFQQIDYKGELKIYFKIYEKELFILIEDNGIGIDISKKMKKDKSISHKSLATKITEERIHNINRFKRKKIKFFIQDLSESGGTTSGTRVELYVPYLPNNDEI